MTKLSDIVKKDNIIKVSINDYLSSVLSKLASSHDGAFVFAEKNKYLGMINPYYCLIKSSYPGNAKVEHCIFHPPKIKINMPISKVAQSFIDSKIHYLPVFDEKEKFMGIISARHLLSQYTQSNYFRIKIAEILKHKNNTLITVYDDDSIAQAISVFKQRKVSKLVVVGHDMKLKGILSYYDLVNYLIAPKTRAFRGDKEGSQTNFHHMKVRNFSKVYVLTLSSERLLMEALNLVLKKNIGSVVIVDEGRHPIGIITTRDLLGALIQTNLEKRIEVASQNLSPKNRQILGGFFNRFNFFIKKQPNVTKAKLYVKEEKGGGLFRVVVSLFPKKGQPEVIKKEGKNLPHVLEPIVAIIRKIKK
jgi:CBS domain-containing protein